MDSIWWGKSPQESLKFKNSEEVGEKPSKKAWIRKSIFSAIRRGEQEDQKIRIYINSRQS